MVIETTSIYLKQKKRITKTNNCSKFSEKKTCSYNIFNFYKRNVLRRRSISTIKLRIILMLLFFHINFISTQYLQLFGNY